jgi:hypothetical protein
MLSMTFDRLQSLKNSLTYDSEMTTRRYIGRTLQVWLLPIILIFILPFAWHNELSETPLNACWTIYIVKREFTAYIFLPIFFWSSVAVVAMYIPIMKIALRHSRSIAAQQVNPEQSLNFKKELAILKTATTIILPFFACWLPWCLIAATFVYNIDEYMSPGPRFAILPYTSFLAILASGINPIIYAVRLLEYRAAFKHLLRLSCCNTRVAPASNG